MPLYQYSAISSQGKATKGIIDADSLLVAKDRLRKQQVMVTRVVLLKSKKDQRMLDAQMLFSFTRELSQLLKAGLPLYESLLTIEEKHTRHKAHPLFLDLCDHLKEGASLSSALKGYPTTFDKIYLSMVQVGEESGNLAEVFGQLAQLIQRQQKLKKQLISALAYPSFLALFCFLITCALMFFIVPSMKELFEGRDLHPITALVLGLSHWVNAHIPLMLLLLTACIGAISFCVGSVEAKKQLYRYFLRLPFVKTLLLDSALLRFCRSLSMLLQGGVPLLEALSLSCNLVKNPLLEASILEAQKRVGQGERLSQALIGAPLIPPLVLRMLCLAEETGKMGESLLHLAEIYDEEMERHLSQISTFLQPALLLLLGAIVGLVVLSILLPLTDVSSFITN